MPEEGARRPAQNRHGEATRGERVPLDARRASIGTARRAPKRATTEDLRLSALRPPLLGWMEKRQAKPRAQQRAVGTKKTALFDIVNRNYAATRSVPAERAKNRARFSPGPRKSCRVGIARDSASPASLVRAQCPRVFCAWAKSRTAGAKSLPR